MKRGSRKWPRPYSGVKPRELTKRQTQIATLLASSFTRKQIAVMLNVTDKAVEYHVGIIGPRLGCWGNDIAAITRWAIRHGLVKASGNRTLAPSFTRWAVKHGLKV